PSRRRDHFGGQQTKNDAVLVRCPDRTVFTEKTGAGALFAAETDGSVKQPGRKPFETDGNLEQFAAEPLDGAINQRAADQSFSDRCFFVPLRARAQKVINRYREIVIRVHQAQRRGDNPMTIRVRIVSEGNLKSIFEFY